MSSFANILVPFDGSDAAKRALATAVDIAADNAVVTAIQVADQPTAADPTVVVAERMAGVVRDEAVVEQEISQYWGNVESSLKAAADEAVAAAGRNVEMRAVVKSGAPALVIADYAKESGVDLIVMGRRGLGSVRSMIGSVSQRVAHETDLPLLVVK